MIVVLGLPCPDRGAETPELSMHVRRYWERYEGKTQTTSQTQHFWSHHLPDELAVDFTGIEVPSTDAAQESLKPFVSQVKWIPTDTTNGVAIVTGKNFFPGTTVRLGNRTYSTAADGLIIKSDHELEVTASLGAAAVGGVVSGRYGQAQPLESRSGVIPSGGFQLGGFRIYPQGNDLDEVIADLLILPDSNGHVATLQEIETNLNSPIVLVNGVPMPISGTMYLTQAPSSPSYVNPPIELNAFVPATAFSKGAPLTVTFPFAGPRWTASMPYYETTLKVSRLGGDKEARLLISATNPADALCSDWVLQLNEEKEFRLLSDGAPIPADGGLKCVDHKKQVLSLEIPAKDLKSYHRFLLVNRIQKDPKPPLIGDIPAPEPPPPGPSLDENQKLSVSQNDIPVVKLTGKHLDQVTKVLCDKIQLKIVKQEDKEIVISLPPEVTGKARDNVALQLISDGNDPVIALLTVTAAKKGK
jgi:hypothetical protein